MSIAASSDRTEYAERHWGLYLNAPAHPPVWVPTPGSGEKSRAFFERPASGSTEPFKGSFVRPSRYHLARVRRTSHHANFWIHGGPGPFCVQESGVQSVRDCFGADLMMRGWDPTTKMPTVPNHLIAKADEKCLEGISVNLPENFAEYESSLTSMGNLLERGFDLLVDYAHKAKRIRDPRILADTWLTYQYGLKPLISDIVELSKFKLESPGFKTSRGQASEVWDSSGVQLVNYGYTQVQAIERTRWGCNTQVAYTVDSPLLAGLSSLGLGNPALLFWELVPFSFMVDWFVNIGQVVASINQGMGLTFLWGSRTRWLKPDYNVSWHPKLASTDTIAGTYWRETCSGGIFYHREVLDSFPIPPLSWRPRLDLTKLLNAIAIFKR